MPRRDDIRIEIMDEHLQPGKPKPQFEILECDVAGYLLAGSLVLEIEGEKKQTLRTGDAFYIHKGKRHRGYATGNVPARLITVCYPPSY